MLAYEACRTMSVSIWVCTGVGRSVCMYMLGVCAYARVPVGVWECVGRRVCVCRCKGMCVSIMRRM